MHYLNKLSKLILHPFKNNIYQPTPQVSTKHHKLMEEMAVLQGRTLALANADRAPLNSIRDAEFKVFSQFGDDGIIQYLIRETGITKEETSFIEFGVQDYTESNTRFLLINDNWRGMIIDGSKQYMDSVRESNFYWKYDLTAVHAWINRDNINQLIGDSGFSGSTGILSIDIDGNDYWVLEKIDVVNPVIIIAEWNGLFGPTHTISIPYDPNFQRHRAHYSHLFWGASVGAFEYLAKKKGYSLVGSNSAGNNLHFVRNDRLGRLKRLSPIEAFIEPRFRESRDASGKLNFLSGDQRRAELLDMPVFDVISGELTTMRKLDALLK